MIYVIAAAGSVLAIVVLVLAWVSRVRYGRRALNDWARTHKYEILSRERRPFLRGPFGIGLGEGAIVFRVIVRDSEGRVRAGHVRFGSVWLGLLSDKIETVWD